MRDASLRRPAKPRAASISALLLAGGLSGCGPGEPAGPPPAWPPAHVVVAPVTVRDVPVYLDEIGKCAASEVVSIQPQVTGQVKDIHFIDGAELTKGQPLFTIDPRPFQAKLDQAEAELARSRALAELRGLEFTRAKGLLGSRAIAKQDYDTRENAVKVAEASVLAAAAAAEQARVDLAYTAIASPIAGRAGRRLVDRGNIVSPGDRTAMLLIQNLAPIYAELTIPEADLPRVRAAIERKTAKVEVRSPSEPDFEREGDLTFLDSAVQDGTGTVMLRATVKNDDRRLWPGQFVRVRLVLDEMKHALLVPSGATQIGQAGPYVYVLKADSTVDMRVVTLGQKQQGDTVVVQTGLAPGDKVVTAGTLLMLYPGARVDASEGAPQSKEQRP